MLNIPTHEWILLAALFLFACGPLMWKGANKAWASLPKSAPERIIPDQEPLHDLLFEFRTIRNYVEKALTDSQSPILDRIDKVESLAEMSNSLLHTLIASSQSIDKRMESMNNLLGASTSASRKLIQQMTGESGTEEEQLITEARDLQQQYPGLTFKQAYERVEKTRVYRETGGM